MIHRTTVAILIIIVFMTPCIAGSASGFKDVLNTPAMKSPLASKSLLNGITVAGKRLISVGQRGHILYSDDGGKSWIQAESPVSSDLVAVHFPSPNKGWAVGHDGVVLHSADGGVTWVKQFDGYSASRLMQSYYKEHPPVDISGGRTIEMINRLVEEGPDKSFLDVWFDDENSGFIVGAFNLIFQTTDGGKSWKPWFDRTENPKYLHLYAIRKIGQDIFISGEQGMVLKLDPQAGKFRRLNTPYRGTFFGITGSSGTIVVFGLRGNVFCSTNRGISWRKIETGVTGGLTGATVTNDGSIILVSQTGDVLISKDGGLSFNMIKVENPFPYTAVAAFNGDTLVLAGFGGVEIQSIK